MLATHVMSASGDRLINQNSCRFIVSPSPPHVQYLLLSVLSCGSSDIPRHNKSAVRFTIAPLWACGPGPSRGVFSPSSHTAWRAWQREWCPYEVTDALSFLWMSVILQLEQQNKRRGGISLPEVELLSQILSAPRWQGRKSGVVSSHDVAVGGFRA